MAIDRTILDQIIPLPDEQEAMEELQVQLQAEGFPVNNFHKGGVFYGLARLLIRVYVEILTLARTMVHSCFARHATGTWLTVKAADYGKRRKAATKVQGWITITRRDAAEATVIYQGHCFKTAPDISGKEWKYYCLEDTILPAKETVSRVLIEAEDYGSAYHVAAGGINRSLVHIEGIDTITNEDDWLFQEAADEESDIALQERLLNSYSELAERTTSAKLKSIAEEVDGVIHVTIDDQHPRGQGTVDIIVTGTAGEATQQLLSQVEQATVYLRGQYEDWLFRSATVVHQDITIDIYLIPGMSVEGVAELATKKIQSLLNVYRDELNRLYLDDLRYLLKQHIPGYRTAEIAKPESDIKQPVGTVILPGTMQITVSNLTD